MMKGIKRFMLSLATLFALVTSNGVSSTQLTFTTQDFAPFSYLNEHGRVAGPAVEVIKLICSSINIPCSFRLLPWSRAQIQVRKGIANGMFVIGWNERRAKWMQFSPPMLNTQYGFFIQKGRNITFTQLKDIQGLTIGVYGPSNTLNSLKKIRQEMIKNGAEPIKIDIRPDDESGFHKLSLGRVDVVYSNRDVGRALLKKLNIENVEYAGTQKKLKYYIGFNKEHNDKKLIALFNHAFKILQSQGKIQGIIRSFDMEPSELFISDDQEFELYGNLGLVIKSNYTDESKKRVNAIYPGVVQTDHRAKDKQ